MAAQKITYDQLLTNFKEYKFRMDQGEKFLITNFDSKPEDYIAHMDRIPDIEFADMTIKGVHRDHNDAS